jgi:hypothetical protein
VGLLFCIFLVRFDRRHTRVVSYLLWYKCQK